MKRDLIILYNDFFELSDLDLTEKMVLAYLAYLSRYMLNCHSGVTPNKPEISKVLGISSRKLTSIMQKLETLNYIASEEKEDRELNPTLRTSTIQCKMNESKLSGRILTVNR